MIRYRFDHDRPQKALHQCESAKNSSLKNMSLHIDGNIMPVVTQFSDLGILMSNNLLPGNHIISIVAKTHQRANSIHRCFVSRDINLLVRAYTVYVRPLIEYNSIVWSPCLKQDIEAIECVQRRFTKRLP